MINWKEISDLHVVSKLRQILERWFQLELIFVDKNGKIRGQHLNGDYQSVSQLFKVQRALSYGTEYIENDVETFVGLMESKESPVLYDSFFQGLKGVATPVLIDGDVEGYALAYPFFLDNVTKSEVSNVEDKFIELGGDKDDVKSAIDHVKKLDTASYEYLRELIDLVSQEVATFHTEITKREERINDLSSELGNKYRYHSMIGKSKGMQDIYRLIEKVANTESSVFIQGANGTGKELVAKAVHYFSPRKDNMFLAVNCSAFNDNLLDSELFGHVKGAFTGAIKDKKGLFETANGGTLFLDEIGDTSLSMQVKLLRVLQEGTYLPVGANAPKKVDVRIIAATNRDLKEMMKNGEFREDLFYRINVINIKLPDLKNRKEDIPLLIEHFLQKQCAEAGVATKVLSKKCLEKILDYHWPGNVRELENEVERLVVLAGEDKIITPELLSSKLIDKGDLESSKVARGINTNGTLRQALDELEALMIKEGLKRCNFNKSKLSKELGVSRASLISKVEKYGLDKRKKVS